MLLPRAPRWRSAAAHLFFETRQPIAATIGTVVRCVLSRSVRYREIAFARDDRVSPPIAVKRVLFLRVAANSQLATSLDFAADPTP